MSDQIPLMFQAQMAGRSQIQKLNTKLEKHEQQQAYDWSDQWCRAIDRKQLPKFDSSTQTKDYDFTWRMVTNSGQDAGLIRPVIGARGWAFFPGSSMKGAFRRSASGSFSKADLLKFCGGDDDEGGFKPGILRFQGGYPKNIDWIDDSLVDVVHPQESWQLNGQKDNGAFIQISLYQPTFVFGISSSETLTPIEWETIWKIWDRAIGRGIGSRVSAGYGQTKAHGESSLLTVRLRGEGIASQRINKEGEFRPNAFKAALRGHTQRLLSGVADWETVEQLTKALWGGFSKNGAIVGQLGIAFSAPDLELNYRNRATVYNVEEAVLSILMMQDVSEQQRKNLKIFTIQLIKFSMLLGGFGKSWRRIEHGRFFPSYLNDSRKCTIGCHWEFEDQSLKSYCIPVKQLEDVTRFLDDLQRNVAKFPMLKKYSPKSPDRILRETWKKGNVEVWGRIADGEDDSEAVHWFHGAYEGSRSIYKSELTGSMGQIGRMWHRMYPRYLPPTVEKMPPKDTGEFIELLTIFPNRSGKDAAKTQEFLDFLRDRSDFEKLW